MTTSRLHSRLSRVLGRLVVTLSEEFGLTISCDGDFTLNREDLKRGLEPDECFYIQNELAVRNKEEVDLTVDPPPDLAIEIDVSRSSIPRLGIYAQIGVPEIWRFKESLLECYLRSEAGDYTRSEVSAAFPGLRPQALMPFVLRMLDTDQNALVREFRAWVHEQIAQGWGETPCP
jgi:Uma2 family endonuclease